MDHKEEFCGACVAGGIALAGAGAAVGSTTSSTKKYKKQKRTMFWCGLFTILFSIAFVVYIYQDKENCQQCSSSSLETH